MEICGPTYEYGAEIHQALGFIRNSICKVSLLANRWTHFLCWMWSHHHPLLSRNDHLTYRHIPQPCSHIDTSPSHSHVTEDAFPPCVVWIHCHFDRWKYQQRKCHVNVYDSPPLGVWDTCLAPGFGINKGFGKFFIPPTQEVKLC